MVSSWAENSPTATTCRCTGSGSPPSRQKSRQEIRRPGFAEESVRVVESCELRHSSDTERHSRRAVLGSPGLSPRDAPHHHDSIITARGGHGRFLTQSALPITHHLAPSHITMARGRRTVAGTPPPTSVLRHSVTRRRAAQHLSNELVEHIRRHRSRPCR